MEVDHAGLAVMLISIGTGIVVIGIMLRIMYIEHRSTELDEKEMHINFNRLTTKLTKDKDQAYTERNQVIVALGHLAEMLGYEVYRTKHTHIDSEEVWDEKWQDVIVIELPSGQVTWHFPVEEAHLMSVFPSKDNGWDRHTTATKYKRLESLQDYNEEGHNGCIK